MPMWYAVNEKKIKWQKTNCNLEKNNLKLNLLTNYYVLRFVTQTVWKIAPK